MTDLHSCIAARASRHDQADLRLRLGGSLLAVVLLLEAIGGMVCSAGIPGTSDSGIRLTATAFPAR